mmetsp:Transcript_11127/g.31335  ORF Transcript_11127/g.31335 Transcript_11127/m.31335 type:complete len:314 (-) Transcript_11127:359-1300(-)
MRTTMTTARRMAAPSIQHVPHVSPSSTPTVVSTTMVMMPSTMSMMRTKSWTASQHSLRKESSFLSAMALAPKVSMRDWRLAGAGSRPVSGEERRTREVRAAAATSASASACCRSGEWSGKGSLPAFSLIRATRLAMCVSALKTSLGASASASASPSPPAFDPTAAAAAALVAACSSILPRAFSSTPARASRVRSLASSDRSSLLTGNGAWARSSALRSVTSWTMSARAAERRLYSARTLAPVDVVDRADPTERLESSFAMAGRPGGSPLLLLPFCPPVLLLIVIFIFCSQDSAFFDFKVLSSTNTHTGQTRFQ